MMPLTDETFIHAILENPQEDANWLVYSDWLEEAGDPRAALYRQRFWTNSIGMTFALIPRGSFWMGGGGGQAGDRQVEIAHEFYAEVHCVTQGKWSFIMGNNPSRYSRQGQGARQVKRIPETELLSFPVESVSWNDAQLFIQALQERERESVSGRYRLPKEEEWEYLCRAAAWSREECSFDFYLEEPSNELACHQAHFDSNHPVGHPCMGRPVKRPAKVGSFPSNRLGLHDLHGNVWEWTDSQHGADRVLRGGCWHSPGAACRAANRNWDDPTSRRSSVGFRLVVVPQPRDR